MAKLMVRARCNGTVELRLQARMSGLSASLGPKSLEGIVGNVSFMASGGEFIWKFGYFTAGCRSQSLSDDTQVTCAYQKRRRSLYHNCQDKESARCTTRLSELFIVEWISIDTELASRINVVLDLLITSRTKFMPMYMSSCN